MKNYAIILLTFIAFIACNTEEEQITFETLTHNEKALLFPNKKDIVPYVTLSYQFTYPKTFKNAEKLKGLQKIFQELFFGEGYGKYNSPKKAKNAYVKERIAFYRKYAKSDIQNMVYERSNNIILHTDSIISFEVSDNSDEGTDFSLYWSEGATVNLNSLKIILPKDIFIEDYYEKLGRIIRSELLIIEKENIEEYKKSGDTYFYEFEKIMPSDNICLTKTGIKFNYNNAEIVPTENESGESHYVLEVPYEKMQHILQQEKVQSYFKEVIFDKNAKPIEDDDITDYQNPKIAYVKNNKIYFYYPKNKAIKEFKKEKEPVFNCIFHSIENKLYYTTVKNGTLWLKQVNFSKNDTLAVSSLGNFNISKDKCISETTGEKSKLLYHQNKVYLIHDFIWDIYGFDKVTAYDLTSNKVSLSNYSPHQIEKKVFEFEDENPALSTQNQQLLYTHQGVTTSLSDSIDFSVSELSDSIDFSVSESEEMNLEFLSFKFSADKSKLLFGVVQGFGDLPHGPFCVADTNGKNQQKLIKDGLSSDYKPLWIGNQLVFINSKQKSEDEYIKQICISSAKDNTYEVIDEDVDYFTVSTIKQKEKLEFVAKNIEKATFKPVRVDWQHDYGFDKGGLLNKYEYVRSLLSYGQLQAILDYPIFLSGPHTKDALNLKADDSFGHYNPKFVSELRDDIKEIISNKTFVKHTKPIVEKYNFLAFLKGYKAIYDITKNNPEEFNEVKTKYIKTSYGRATLPDIINTEPYWNWGETSYRFWIRRDIDNTKEIWIGIINDILSTYE